MIFVNTIRQGEAQRHCTTTTAAAAATNLAVADTHTNAHETVGVKHKVGLTLECVDEEAVDEEDDDGGGGGPEWCGCR